MYRYIFLFLISLNLIASISEAAQEEVAFFDAEKVLVEKDYVLHDVLEFSLFDLSEVKLINDSKPIKDTGPQLVKKKGVKVRVLDALQEMQMGLENLPSYFYKNLRQQIRAQEVPVTLFAKNPPSYSKPLQLYIKVKRIHLKDNSLADDAIHYNQPFSFRIYGQISDKKSGTVLFKFYDTTRGEFVLGQNQVNQALQKVADDLMHDFALYLRTKY